MKELQDQTVIILGGSSGIGLAIACAVVRDGGFAIVAGRDAKRLARARAALGARGEARRLDITQHAAVRHFFRQCDTIDHLVITAAIGAMGPFLKLPVSQARRFFDVKFWGAWHAVKCAAPHLGSKGSVLLVAGVESRKATPQLACASATDAALEALGRSLAVELAPIRVNVISPGPIDTPLYDALPTEAKDRYFHFVSKSHPLKRIGRAEEVAEAALFLMTNLYITGTTLDIDGGARLV